MNSQLQIAVQPYETSAPGYGKDSTQLVNDLQDDEEDGVDGSVQKNFKASEPDLFEQSIQMRT